MTNIDLTRETDELRASGLNVLPADAARKRPIGAWKRWQNERREDFADFERADAICVVGGRTSGNLEILDFDFEAASFEDFCRAAERRGLADVLTRCVVESTQSGGKHLAYRCAEPVSGNAKLARKRFFKGIEDYSGELRVGTKTIRADKAGRYVATTIETRGEGGICLIAPSRGYSVERGDWRTLPTLTADERARIWDAAKSLDDDRDSAPAPEPESAPKRESPPAPVSAPRSEPSVVDGASVADYLRDNDFARRTLIANGWKFAYRDETKEYWTRAGKSEGVSASLDPATGYVFCWSSNAAPLEAERGYTPLELVAAFDFDGSASAASREWRRRIAEETAPVVESGPARVSFATGGAESNAEESSAEFVDRAEPGAAPFRVAPPSRIENATKLFPKELLQAPGLLRAIVSFTNQTAIRYQPELAFAGALAFVSFLCGRKICADGGATTPNLYVVGLGGASSGKNAARETNRRLIASARLESRLIEKFESVQSLQNAICAQKKILLQQDEFGQELQTTSLAAGGANRFGLISELLKLYSNAGNERYSPRVVAANYATRKPTAASVVAFPFLTLYGTTNYKDFFDAATGALLRNGFIARSTIVAGREYSPKKRKSFDESLERRVSDLPEFAVASVAKWSAFRRCKEIETPTPFVVPFERDSFERLADWEEREVEPLVERNATRDDGLAEFLGRIGEKSRKYALLFAASKFGPDESTLRIDVESVENAIRLARYETTLFSSTIRDRIGETKEQKAVVDARSWIASLAGRQFTKAEFTRRFWRLSKRERDDALETLVETGTISRALVVDSKTGKKTNRFVVGEVADGRN